MAITALAFAAFFAAGLIAALLFRPIYGLYTYLAVFYLHPPSRWWGPMLPELRWSLVAAVVTLIAILIHREASPKKKQLSRSGIFVLVSLYVSWMWIQLAFVPSSSHFEGVVLFTKYILLIYLIVKIVTTEKTFFGFCLANTLGCAYFGWLIWQASGVGRLDGVGGPGVDDSSTLGMQLGVGLFFGSFLLFQCKGKVRYLILLLLPIIANGVIQTETRGAVVGVMLGGLVTIFLKPKSIKKAYYGMAVLGLIGVLFAVNEAFLYRMNSMVAAVNEQQEWDSSAESRIHVAKAQWKMFLDYPLGAGHQGTAFLSTSYIDSRWYAETGDRASHNTMLSVLVDQGLPGIILFSLLLMKIAGALFHNKSLDTQGLPEWIGIYRTMLAGALATIFGAGMFAQFLKAEVQIWCLALLIILVQFSEEFVRRKNDMPVDHST